MLIISKKFNDTWRPPGWRQGTSIRVGNTLSVVSRKDMAALWREEFAVILPQTALSGAEAIAEQIRDAISSGILKDKKAIGIMDE